MKDILPSLFSVNVEKAKLRDLRNELKEAKNELKILKNSQYHPSFGRKLSKSRLKDAHIRVEEAHEDYMRQRKLYEDLLEKMFVYTKIGVV